MMRERRGAVTPARDRAPVLRRAAQSTRARRLVVPQLEEIAARLSASQLASIRLQAQPGERIAVYQATGSFVGRLNYTGNADEFYAAARSVMFLITGPSRKLASPPASIDGGLWQLCGVVEITEDGERALPIAV